MTEAAYARGFDSPHRRPFHQLAMGFLDWMLLIGVVVVSVGLVVWK
jgi:energy-coupling factor transporter transmembrane protein EcfT